MRVIIAAKFSPDGARPMGGVQSWVSTVRRALEKLGHEVTVWEPECGLPQQSRVFDLGILANARHTKALEIFCERTLWVSHGIIDEERPPEGRACVFVSDGVRKHWRRLGRVLPQPIDTEFWSPRPIERDLIVRFSYRQSQTVCEAASKLMARHHGVPLEYRHVHDASPLEARELLTRAALVFASGRAALEAMACGAAVVVYDHRSAYQPPLLGMGATRQMAQSYSGRGGVRNPTPQRVAAEAMNALELGGAYFRQHVLTFHRASLVVAELLSIAEAIDA